MELGIAQGMAWSYENLKSATDKEIADKIWRNYLDGTDELCIIFRTIVNLSNDDTNSKIEKLMERLSETKKPEKVMSDDDRDMIEEFLEYLQHKNENKKSN